MGNQKSKNRSFGKIEPVGIFETIKVTADGIVVPGLHWERMSKGGKLLGITIPAYDEWLNKIETYLKETKIEQLPFALRAEIRKDPSLISDQSQNHNHNNQWLFSTRAISYTREQYEEGVRVLFMPEHRVDPIPLNYIKSADFLDAAAALRAVQGSGAFEGIWLNSRGQIMEGTRSNVFFVKNGHLYTPSLESGCLAGIRRRIVIEKALELTIPFSEGVYYPKDLLNADEVFLTNSLMEVMPVSELEEKVFQLDGTLGRRLLLAIHGIAALDHP
jgi:4-amino-4-deoxychorismate lyase